MYEKAKNYTLARPYLRRILGLFLVVLGLLAVVAPIVPGAPVVFIGLELLGLRFLFIDRLLQRKVVRVTSEEKVA